MIVNDFIYFHIGVCIFLIIFEMFLIVYMRIRDKYVNSKMKKYKKEIVEQIDKGIISKKHLNMLLRQMKFTSNLLSFETACNYIKTQMPIQMKEYIEEISTVFGSLTDTYSKIKDKMENAYFSYFIGENFTGLENLKVRRTLIEYLLSQVNSKSFYCRVNAIEAIFKIGTITHIIRCINILSKSKYTYNNELLVDNLENSHQEKKTLAKILFRNFNHYNKNIQIAIIKFLSNNKYIDEELILEKLKNDSTSIDIKCEIMRYFQKNKNEKAKKYLIEQLSNKENVANDLNIKAIGTLGYYEDEDVTYLLNNLKYSKDEFIKESAYKSLEKKQKIQREKLQKVF